MNTTTYKPEVRSVWLEVIEDNDPDTSWLETDEWADRLAAYRNGDFGFIGLRAACEIYFKTPQGGWTGLNTISSPGLWGIESDSGEKYLREVGGEEMTELRDMLAALGIETKADDFDADDLELRYR